MKNPTVSRLASLSLGLLAMFFAFGCLGGGGGNSAFSPGTAPDALAITQTVTGFMRAMVSGNTAATNRMLSPRMQTAASVGSVIASLTLYDFGADINNPADDASWTFLIRDGGINQTSESFATVVADGITPEGKLLQVAFELVKIEGTWYIDNITLIDADGNSYDMPSMFPMNPGDEWIYTLSPTGSQTGVTKIRRVVGSQTELLGGKNVAQIFETSETVSSLSGLVRPEDSTGIRTLFYPIKIRERYSTDGGVFYFGQDEWFNNNVPLQLVSAKGRPGTISTQTITLTVAGKTSTADVQIKILPEEVMETPLKTLKVLPIDVFVTYREPYLFSYTREHEIWYLAANLGLVGFQIFDPNDPTKPLYQSKIQEAVVAGTSFFPSTELATPTVLAVFPANGAAGIAPQTAIYADFSKALAPIGTSSTLISVVASGQSVLGIASVVNNRLSFQPNTVLPEGGEVVVTIASTVRDIRGIALGRPFTWKFATAITRNRAPTFVKGPDIVVREDSGAFTQANWASAISPGADSETAQNLAFQVQNNHPGLFAANLPPTISSAGTLMFTPAPDVYGSATIEVSLRDDGGSSDGGSDVSATQTFVITITPVNDAPSFIKGQNVLVNLASGAQVIANWAGGFFPGPSNEAHQTLQFLVIPTIPNLFLVPPTISATGTLSFSPARTGTTMVSVQLSDNGGTADGGVNLSPVQTFEITVVLPNQPPSFTKGADIVMTPNEGEKIITNWATNISPGHTEESGQTLEFQISTNRPDLFSGPPILQNTGQLAFIPYGIGVATVSVSLKDNGGTLNGGQDLSATQTFTITLNAAPNKSVTWRRSIASTLIEKAGCAVINGRVFVFGGDDGDGTPLNRMEEYKAATNEWVDVTATYPFPSGKGRMGFGSAVYNNQIYLVGGTKQDGFGSDILRFNGSSWEQLPGISLPSGTCSDFAVAVLNDKLYLIGGDDSGATAQVYTLDLNPLGSVFSEVTSLQTARHHHSATVFDGKIVIAGGYDIGWTELNTVEVYDSGLDSWDFIDDLSTERTMLALLSTGNSLLAIGGSTSTVQTDSVEILTSLAGTWTTQSPVLPERVNSHLAAIVDGRPMIFGGWNDDSWDYPRVHEFRDGQWYAKTVPQLLNKPGLVAHNSKLYLFGGEDQDGLNTKAWEYDPQIHIWKQLPQMIGGGGYQYGAAVVNNVIMSLSDDFSSLTTMEFNPSTNSWQSRSTIPESTRSYLAGTSLLGKFYAAGGLEFGSGDSTDFLHAFDPAANTWSTLAPMPFALSDHSATMINNRFLVFGGAYSEYTAGEYDPISNQWVEKTSSDYSHEKSAAVTCSGKVFILGGYSASDEDFTSQVLEFDPFTNAWNPTRSNLYWARQNAGAAVIGNQIFVVGGDEGVAFPLGHMEVGTVQ
jgi:N-acetylneuraminic acid mutarotase